MAITTSWSPWRCCLFCLKPPWHFENTWVFIDCDNGCPLIQTSINQMIHWEAGWETLLVMVDALACALCYRALRRRILTLAVAQGVLSLNHLREKTELPLNDSDLSKWKLWLLELFISDCCRSCLVETYGDVLLDTGSINILLTPQRNFSNASLSLSFLPPPPLLPPPLATTADPPSSYLCVSSSLKCYQNNHNKIPTQVDVYMVCGNTSSLYDTHNDVATYSTENTVNYAVLTHFIIETTSLQHNLPLGPINIHNINKRNINKHSTRRSVEVWIQNKVW